MQLEFLILFPDFVNNAMKIIGIKWVLVVFDLEGKRTSRLVNDR